MSRVLLGATVVAAWLCSAATGLAADTVMVLEFEGAKKQAVRERVIQALEAEKIDVEALEKELRGRKPDEKRLSKVGKRKSVGVFLAGNVVLKKSGWTLTLTARDGETGTPEGELPLKAAWLPKLLEAIDAEAPKFAREHLGAAEPAKAEPAKAEPGEAEPPAAEDEEARKPEEKKPEKEEPEADEGDADAATAGKRPSPLTFGIGLRAVRRDFSYHQDVNGNLRPYELPLAPAAAAALAWYPAAHFTGGAAAHVGVVLDVERTLFASSDLEEGSEDFDTVLFAYSAGLRGRLPLDAHELGLSVRFGRQAFEVEGDADPAAMSANGTRLTRDLVPNVAYTFVRPALEARFAFGPVGLGLALGYRHVLEAGDIQNAAWFPDATVTAGDLSLFGSYELTPAFHAVLGLDARRYGFDMNSKPADVLAGRDAAGGAVDQYLGGWLGIEWRPPGD